MFFTFNLSAMRIERKMDNRILSAIKIPAGAEDFTSMPQQEVKMNWPNGRKQNDLI